MITQQVASYLIKKMEAAVKSPQSAPTDRTDELFKTYLRVKGSRSPSQIVTGGEANDQAIVDAFRWRAADLVRNPASLCPSR